MVTDDVRHLVDRTAIVELTARYNRAFDGVDVEGWLRTFTEDGVMVRDGRAWRGHDELRRLIERVGYGMVHLTTDPVITISGDVAQQECSLLLLRRDPDRRQVHVLTTGRYRDELARTSAGWRFRLRDVTTDADL
jgi:hypothetical protein